MPAVLDVAATGKSEEVATVVGTPPVEITRLLIFFIPKR
jgi:hypothetical protein